MNDVVIIGKGPSGVSAAIYLKRAGIDVVVIGKDLGSLNTEHTIENYYGFSEPIVGKDLIQMGIKQAQNIGIPVVEDEIVGISKEEEFKVVGVNREYTAKAVMLAMGKARKGLKINGFKEFQGKGISFCAVCDGFFYRGKNLAVIGSGDYAIAEMNELLNITDKVTLFTDGNKLEHEINSDKVKVIEGKISEIYGDSVVKGISIGEDKYDVDGIFVAIGTAGAVDFALKMGVYIEGDSIEIDQDYMTNIDGLFAGGDCIGGFLQVSKAVADGANASKSIIKYIKNLSK